MFSIHDHGTRLCDGLTRREWLRIGGLGLAEKDIWTIGLAGEAVRGDAAILLVNQFRHTTRTRDWELPAGRVEPGEAPEDAARLIVWICSDDARWITGQTIDSEGGFRRWS